MLSYEAVTGGTTHYFVQIPKAKDHKQLVRQNKRKNWMSNFLFALGGCCTDEQDEDETLLDLLCFSAKSNRDIWEKAVGLNGFVLPEIDPVDTRAVQSMCNMNQNQMKMMRSCLRILVGSSLFATEHKVKQIIGIEFVEPITGHAMNGNERIPWSYKPLDECLCVWLKSQLKEKLIKTSDSLEIDVVVNLDHGKGHSRASVNFIARWEEDDGKRCETATPCHLGNAKCHKDNSAIIQNTFGKKLDEDMLKIKARKGLNVFKTPDGEWEVNLEQTPPEDSSLIKTTLWFAADILLYCIALGKEGMAGWWCPYCKLMSTEWKEKNHPRGELWTLELLKEHATKLLTMNKPTPQEVKGVKEPPIFTAVEITHYIISILHILLGRVNDNYDNFLKEMQAAGEDFTLDCINAEKTLCYEDAKLKEAKKQLSVFFTLNRE